MHSSSTATRDKHDPINLGAPNAQWEGVLEVGGHKNEYLTI